MNDEPQLHPDVFNTAMKSIYRELEEIKSLLLRREISREKDVETLALHTAEINTLKDARLEDAKLRKAIFASVASLFVWELVKIIVKR